MEARLLLALDIGNTRITMGVWEGSKLAGTWEMQPELQKTADEYGILVKSLLSGSGIEPGKIQAAVAASVVPPLTGTFEKMVQKYFNGIKFVIVGPGIKTGLAIKIENPREIGASLIANAVAALALYRPPLIVVDFGTATTFCALGANGEYLGGAIAPGMDVAGEALFYQTAKLPRFEMIRPKNAIGKNTVSCLQSGFYFGYLGLVESLVQRIKSELGGLPVVIAAGNLAPMIAEGAGSIDYVNLNLTLEGLRMIYEMNHE